MIGCGLLCMFVAVVAFIILMFKKDQDEMMRQDIRKQKRNYGQHR